MSDNQPPPPRDWKTEAKQDLIRLFREGEVDYRDLSIENVKRVHQGHFLDQKASNFYPNFRKLAKAFGTGVDRDGARRQTAQEQGM